MAWTEQCKIAFKTSTLALVQKQGGKGVAKALRTLSKESGVPAATLKDWYYPRKNRREIPPTNSRPTLIENENENENDKSDRMCPVCEVRKREKDKNRSGTVTYRKFCQRCRHAEELITVRCDHCGQDITFQRKEVL
jgi:hypothetical protein